MIDKVNFDNNKIFVSYKNMIPNMVIPSLLLHSLRSTVEFYGDTRL